MIQNVSRKARKGVIGSLDTGYWMLDRLDRLDELDKLDKAG